ncbi:MAG TPA: hypothetical protein VGM64_13205 [Lacunisphaera sp.]|jgi:sugar lactone lactonase YvrE
MSSSRSSLLLGFLFFTVAVLAQSAALIPVYRWTTLAGRASNGSDDGPASNAQFSHPHGLAMDLSGNLYVADTNNHTVRKIAADGTVSTLAGSATQPGSVDGTGSAARFNHANGIFCSSDGKQWQPWWRFDGSMVCAVSRGTVVDHPTQKSAPTMKLFGLVGGNSTGSGRYMLL